MKIFDCFMYFDEDLLLDLRLNYLNKYVDYFVIVESNFTHRGEKRSLKFNHKKFERFKNKIIYLIYDEEPKKIEMVNESDSKKEKSIKYILNAALRENGQRDHIIKGLDKADKNDFILISDVDEIPNLSNVNFKNIKDKILMFQQDMFYYKFDLKLPDTVWSGTKACRKKDLLSPQWLRNIKDKKYPFWRLDVLFSDKKYSNIKFIDNGGWHFSNMKTPEEIEKKMRTYLHHREYDIKPLGTKKIEEMIKSKKSIYNLRADMKNEKIDGTQNLKATDGRELPEYLKKNKTKYSNWIE